MLLVNTPDPEEKERTEFRYGVPDEQFAEWWTLHKRTGLPQRQILHRLVTFILDQDDVTQGMILGTLEPKPDLIEAVLRRKAEKPRSGMRIAGKPMGPQKGDGPKKK